MPEKRPPSIQLRRLASELVRLRSVAGLTQLQVQERTHISRGALWRAENAVGRPHLQSLVTLLNLYNAPAEVRDELIALHEKANQDGWLSRYSDVLPSEYSALIQFEQEANRISTFQCQTVAGLLQTADYAIANTIATNPNLTEETRRKRVEVRMRRQNVLREHDLEFNVILDEAVIRRPAGGAAVMREQLDKLVEDAGLLNVSLQVVPFDVGAHAGVVGSFSVLDFPEPNPSTVYLEHASGSVFLDNIEDVKQFRATFDNIKSTALDQDQSLELIRAVREATR